MDGALLVLLSGAVLASADVSVHLERRLCGAGQVHEARECITQADMDVTIDAFMNAVVSIGRHADNCTAAKEAALGYLEAAYAYNVLGVNVLSNPTLTLLPHVYRPTKESAPSYFIGKCICPGATSPTDPNVPCGVPERHFAPDDGFALIDGHGWAKVERGGLAKGGREGSGFWYNLDGPFFHAAQAQGPMCFTSAGDGNMTCVDKTFGLVQNPDPSGPLRALLYVHHSSLRL